MSSPEIALCVFFKLLPVEPVLVRPHPDTNLLNKMRIFSLLCLFVCSPGCHRSDRAGKDGGNLSQQGSSLHEQSQSFVSHFTSLLYIQLCSNKAQEYLVPGCLYLSLYLFEIRLGKSTVVFSLRHCVLYFVFLQLVFAQTKPIHVPLYKSLPCSTFCIFAIRLCINQATVNLISVRFAFEQK